MFDHCQTNSAKTIPVMKATAMSLIIPPATDVEKERGGRACS
jgi:hypothetical protein